MKIAQVAPLFESVPPRAYGGTERVVAYLTEELLALGHEVTLYASADSRSSARLIPCVDRALRLQGKQVVDPVAYHLRQVDRVCREAARYDTLHFHLDYLHFPLVRRARCAALTTLHGRLDLPDLPGLFQEFSDMNLVSISQTQRAPLPDARWRRTIHHGLPLGLYPFSPGPGDYLAFLGRVSPEKGVDQAIAIARQAGVPLKIAAKVDKVDRGYFNAVIRPLLGGSTIEFVGEIGDAEKGAFLGGAKALLFPIDWPEPFGLVMIEALACGTPVIAYGRASVPEVLDDGVTGFVVDNAAEAAAAVQRLHQLSRWTCRHVFETRYTARRMAEEYLDLYRGLVGEQGIKAGATRPAIPAV